MKKARTGKKIIFPSACRLPKDVDEGAAELSKLCSAGKVEAVRNHFNLLGPVYGK